MLRSIFTLAFIAFAFAACKKNKAEDPAPQQKQYPLSINGHWRSLTTASWGPDFFAFNPLDSTYRRSNARNIETGPFHTRAFNNPDSLEVQLINHSLIIVRVDNEQIKVTEGDSTRVFKRYYFPG